MLCEKLVREKHVREDGWLAELVSEKYGSESAGFVHSYVVGIKPGCSRAGHFHRKKREWLCLACGRIELFLEGVVSKEKERIIMDDADSEYSLYLIRPGVAHVVRNVGVGPASLVVFSDRVEDQDDTFEYSFG